MVGFLFRITIGPRPSQTVRETAAFVSCQSLSVRVRFAVAVTTRFKNCTKNAHEENAECVVQHHPVVYAEDSEKRFQPAARTVQDVQFR